MKMPAKQEVITQNTLKLEDLEHDKSIKTLLRDKRIAEEKIKQLKREIFELKKQLKQKSSDVTIHQDHWLVKSWIRAWRKVASGKRYQWSHDISDLRTKKVPECFHINRRGLKITHPPHAMSPDNMEYLEVERKYKQLEGEK
jgi:hypothetical protein